MIRLYWIAAFILALLFTASPSQPDELFRWEDKDGVVHFTDNPHNIPDQFKEKASRIKSLAPSKPPENPLFPQRASVPLTGKGATAVVRVVLNGREQVNFIVDTGASYTVISRSTARKLGIKLRKKGPKVRLQTANGMIDAPLVSLESVEVGGMRVTDLKAAVHDFSKDRAVSGLLGLNFLSHFRLDIDTQKGILVLEKK